MPMLRGCWCMILSQRGEPVRCPGCPTVGGQASLGQGDVVWPAMEVLREAVLPERARAPGPHCDLVACGQLSDALFRE